MKTYLSNSNDNLYLDECICGNATEQMRADLLDNLAAQINDIPKDRALIISSFGSGKLGLEYRLFERLVALGFTRIEFNLIYQNYNSDQTNPFIQTFKLGVKQISDSRVTPIKTGVNVLSDAYSITQTLSNTLHTGNYAKLLARMSIYADISDTSKRKPVHINLLIDPPAKTRHIETRKINLPRLYTDFNNHCDALNQYSVPHINATLAGEITIQNNAIEASSPAIQTQGTASGNTNPVNRVKLDDNDDMSNSIDVTNKTDFIKLTEATILASSNPPENYSRSVVENAYDHLEQMNLHTQLKPEMFALYFDRDPHPHFAKAVDDIVSQLLTSNTCVRH